MLSPHAEADVASPPARPHVARQCLVSLTRIHNLRLRGQSADGRGGWGVTSSLEILLVFIILLTYTYPSAHENTCQHAHTGTPHKKASVHPRKAFKGYCVSIHVNVHIHIHIYAFTHAHAHTNTRSSVSVSRKIKINRLRAKIKIANKRSPSINIPCMLNCTSEDH